MTSDHGHSCDEPRHRIQDGYERVRDAAIAAAETGSQPGDDWRGAVTDAIRELDRLIERDAHPDATARARDAVHLLAGIWLDEDEVERIYLGGDHDV